MLRHGAQLGLARRAAQIEQDCASCVDQRYLSRHGNIALGHLSHLGCHTEQAPVGRPGATNLEASYLQRGHNQILAARICWSQSRPGSELQFFPWISENRNTNLVIKKMIKSF